MDFAVFDIGNKYIKIAEISRRFKKLDIQNLHLIPTPHNDAVNYPAQAMYNEITPLDCEQWIAEKIGIDILEQEILSACDRIRSKNAIGIVSNPSIIRNVTVCCKDVRQLKSDIDDKIRATLPDNIHDKFVFDYTGVENIENDIYRVLIIGVARTIVDGYVQLFKKLRLKPYRIDFSGNAVIKYISRIKNHTSAYAVIDVGSKNLVVSVGHKDSLIFSYVCGNNVFDALEHSDEGSFDAMAELLFKTRTALSYYNQNFERQIDTVYFTKPLDMELCKKSLAVNTALLCDVAPQSEIKFFCNCLGF